MRTLLQFNDEAAPTLSHSRAEITSKNHMIVIYVRGWSERGKMIYNKIMKIIKEQRADVTSNGQLRTFDDRLRTRWITRC